MTVLTKQLIFDLVVCHAAEMPRPSTIQQGFGPCAYRAPDGNRCFVGLLVTDAEYKAHDMDNIISQVSGSSVTSLADRDQLPERLLPHLDLLEDLQPVHDSRKPWLWPSNLRSVAEIHGLDTRLLDMFADKIRAVPTR